jgi:hypothetical protein
MGDHRFAKDVAHSLRERVHADVDVSWQLRFRSIGPKATSPRYNGSVI